MKAIDEAACKIQLEADHNQDGSMITSDQLVWAVASLVFRRDWKMERSWRKSEGMGDSHESLKRTKNKISSISIISQCLLCFLSGWSWTSGVLCLEACSYNKNMFFEWGFSALEMVPFKWLTPFLCLVFALFSSGLFRM